VLGKAFAASLQQQEEDGLAAVTAMPMGLPRVVGAQQAAACGWTLGASRSLKMGMSARVWKCSQAMP
jgi:hypothetical protein